MRKISYLQLDRRTTVNLASNIVKPICLIITVPSQLTHFYIYPLLTLTAMNWCYLFTLECECRSSCGAVFSTVSMTQVYKYWNKQCLLNKRTSKIFFSQQKSGNRWITPQDALSILSGSWPSGCSHVDQPRIASQHSIFLCPSWCWRQPFQGFRGASLEKDSCMVPSLLWRERKHIKSFF